MYTTLKNSLKEKIPEKIFYFYVVTAKKEKLAYNASVTENGWCDEDLVFYLYKPGTYLSNMDCLCMIMAVRDCPGPIPERVKEELSNLEDEIYSSVNDKIEDNKELLNNKHAFAEFILQECLLQIEYRNYGWDINIGVSVYENSESVVCKEEVKNSKDPKNQNCGFFKKAFLIKDTDEIIHALAIISLNPKAKTNEIVAPRAEPEIITEEGYMDIKSLLNNPKQLYNTINKLIKEFDLDKDECLNFDEMKGALKRILIDRNISLPLMSDNEIKKLMERHDKHKLGKIDKLYMIGLMREYLGYLADKILSSSK